MHGQTYKLSECVCVCVCVCVRTERGTCIVTGPSNLLEIFVFLVLQLGFPGHVDGRHPHCRVDGGTRLKEIINEIIT